MVAPFSVEQRRAYSGPPRELGFGQVMRYPNVESADVSNLIQVVNNT